VQAPRNNELAHTVNHKRT